MILKRIFVFMQYVVFNRLKTSVFSSFCQSEAEVWHGNNSFSKQSSHVHFSFYGYSAPSPRLYSSHRRLALRLESIWKRPGFDAFFCQKRHCHVPVSECDNAFLAPAFPLLFFLSDFYQNLNIFRSMSDQIFKALLGQCI